MYVYKLNEDKILFCINIHLRTVRAVAIVLPRLQHKPGHRHVRLQERLEKSRGIRITTPLISLNLLIRKAHIVSFPFFFLEIRWLYQNGVLLLGYPVLQMIIIYAKLACVSAVLLHK